MTEPLTATALAAAAVSLVTPYVAEVAKGAATKVGGSLGGGAVALWEKMRSKLVSRGAVSKLDKFLAAPEDARRRIALEIELEDAFEQDPEWCRDIEALVGRLGGSRTEAKQDMVVTGNRNIATQVAGDHNEITIRGQGAGE